MPPNAVQRGVKAQGVATQSLAECPAVVTDATGVGSEAVTGAAPVAIDATEVDAEVGATVAGAACVAIGAT